jgi:hypothetical protein
MEELGLTITQLVESQLPAGFSVSEAYLKNRLKIWQTFSYSQAGVQESDQYNIESYPAKWQIVLGYLILWDIIQKILLGSFIKLSGGDSQNKPSREVKKITTGPSDVEFHNSSESLAALIKALSKEGPIMDAFLKTACSFGTSLGIKLPFCDAVNVMVGPSILKTCNSPTVHNHNCNCNGCLYRPKSLG